MIDLGNNYTEGYAKDVIAPRKNAAEELREVVSGLAGSARSRSPSPTRIRITME